MPDHDVAELTRWGLFAGSDLIGEFADEDEALRELRCCQDEAIAENRRPSMYQVRQINEEG